jgi:hypothetical protein
MSNDDELAALKARVAELEAKAKPPEPFTPEPFQRFDPTAGMSMPRSTMLEMARVVSDADMRDIARHGTIPGPSAAGASGQTTKISSSPGLPGTTNGWRREIPLGPPPGVAACDAIMDAADARDRAELVEREARRLAMQRLAEQK